MNPICVPCKRMYVAVKTGFVVKINDNYVRRGDMFRCPGCGHEMVTNFGEGYRSPIEAGEATLELIKD